jgi:hypothetical protein
MKKQDALSSITLLGKAKAISLTKKQIPMIPIINETDIRSIVYANSVISL